MKSLTSFLRLYWVLPLVVLGAAALGDFELAAFEAGLIHAGEIAAYSLAYILISAGLLVTQYVFVSGCLRHTEDAYQDSVCS